MVHRVTHAQPDTPADNWLKASFDCIGVNSPVDLEEKHF